MYAVIKSIRELAENWYTNLQEVGNVGSDSIF